ncbi:glycosyltransferase family 4 protein [Papillibacter cinnamivorans]|uniref:Glycosyltransferase involved in cell wall bisynthesis n=1 Tax=Papillibacter cinnamivorans DSM 12816 TaxID=1122930 RepID=A0A1W1YNK7_9FIRM|nr:glycosyltransferase family 1 protein [Papillibacter cinnamivorans]SMC37716.1 Glycosyltransferase involved in cell wall bisynthesis [Papillibacter cinnamivorans DSM 12816]
MRIAYFTDTFRPEINGVTNTLEYLSAYLAARNTQHLFFAPDYGGNLTPVKEENVLRFPGVPPFVSPSSRLAFPSGRAVRSAVRDFRPDLIHITSELGVGMSGLQAARSLGIPVVMSYHTNFDRYFAFYYARLLDLPYWTYMKWFHSFAAVNLCPSKSTLGELRGRGMGSLDVWSRGVDLLRFSPRLRSGGVRDSLGGRDKFIFLYVGRIAREKGLDVLARALREVHARMGERARFVFTGDGPYLREMTAMDLPNTVFTGFKQGAELAEIYASADAFVFPSGTETLGNVLLEAMASGLPSVCADSGGVTDFAFHMENAYVAGYESASSLARGMLELASNPLLRRRLGEGGLETARSRSWTGVFDSLMLQYRAVLDGCAPEQGRVAV